MGNKLFEALFETESGISKTYIVAESIEDASRIALKEVSEYSHRITEVDEISNRWNDEIPLGSEDGKTCGQILQEMKHQAAQEEYFRKHQLKLFEEVK